MCHSFQRWTRWVVRKRMQAAAASSSPLASRTPACWRASPSCSSWRRTLDRYSWASSRLLQDHHQLLLEPKQREAGSKFLLYFFLLFSFFGFWTLGILVVRQVRPIVFWSYTRSCFSAVPACRGFKVEGLTALSPQRFNPFCTAALKTSWNINWSSRKRRLYLMCNTLTQSLRCSPFLQTALQASFLNLHPHHPSWLMPLSLHSSQLRFLASVYIMNPLWKAQSGNSSCIPNISDSQALHVPFLFSIPYQKANVKTFKLELFRLPAGLCCLRVDFIFFYTWILTFKDQIWADHWEWWRATQWCLEAHVSASQPVTPKDSGVRHGKGTKWLHPDHGGSISL